MSTPRLAFTRREVAEMCGVSEATVKRAKAAGLLRAKRLDANGERINDRGGKELYRLADVEAWLEGMADA